VRAGLYQCPLIQYERAFGVAMITSVIGQSEDQELAYAPRGAAARSGPSASP
jgi:hypothetical protein